MAKKAPSNRGAARHKATVPVAAVAAGGELPIITVPPGGTLTVVVDVGPMTVDYHVNYMGRSIIAAQLDRAEEVSPLAPGDNLLIWSFTHTEKGWHHAIGFSINGGQVALLEKKSEANKDRDFSTGIAVVRA